MGIFAFQGHNHAKRSHPPSPFILNLNLVVGQVMPRWSMVAACRILKEILDHHHVLFPNTQRKVRKQKGRHERDRDSLSKLLLSMKLPLSLRVLFFLPKPNLPPPLFLPPLLLPPAAPPPQRKMVARKRQATAAHMKPKAYLPSDASRSSDWKAFRPRTYAALFVYFVSVVDLIRSQQEVSRHKGSSQRLEEQSDGDDGAV